VSLSRPVDRVRFGLLLAAGIALVAVKPDVSDVGTDRLYEQRHVLPAFEYPVLARVVFLAERAISASHLGISLVNAVVSVAFAVAVLAALPARARRHVWAAAPILVLVAQTMEGVTCLLLVLMVLAWRDRRWSAAGACAGLGAAFKVVPAVAALPLVVAAGRRGGVRMGATAVVAWLAVNVPYALYDRDRWWFPYRFARQRDDVVATIWAPWHLSISTVNALSLVATAAVLALVCLLVGRRRLDPVNGATLALLGFIVANKVWQPHYALWLVALVPFTSTPTRPLRALELASLAYFAVFWSEPGVEGLGELVWAVAVARLAAAVWLGAALASDGRPAPVRDG
jgi:uncharacterized membrane protein